MSVCQEISPLLQDEARQREGNGVFDVNATNIIQSADDGLLYTHELIVWPLTDEVSSNIVSYDGNARRQALHNVCPRPCAPYSHSSFLL